MNRTVRLLGSTLAATLALAPGAIAAAAVEPGPYVALGDSYTAGPLVPNQTGHPGGCERSDHNYPSLLAERLGVRTFVDVTCSGASTADVTHVQRTFGEARIPPQVRQVTRKTDLVTIGIGGNDLKLFNTLTVHGELSCGPSEDGGFRVHARLPLVAQP